MVANAPAFAEIANGLYTFIGDADLAGFKISSLDIKFLTEEFNRAGLPFTIVNRNIIDTSSIYNTMEKRDFRAAAEKFAGTTLSDEPISSETSNNISAQILNGMIKDYSEDSRFQNTQPETLNNNFNRNKKSLDVSSKIIINKDGRPVFNFGKYIGLLVADTMLVETNYYDWCLNVSDLAGDTKLLIKMITEKARASQSQNTQNV
jgi:DNA polymerase-3 subunit epsilon